MCPAISRYKDESDYALRYMESSFREQQKEEARRYVRLTPETIAFTYYI